MRTTLARLAAIVLLLPLASCSGDGPDYTWLRTMHVVRDAPALRVQFENYVFLENTSFGTSTTERIQSLLKDNGPSSLMKVEYFAPDRTIGGEVLALEVPVQKDFTSTVVLAGTFEEPQPIVVVQPRRPRPLDRLYFQFVHALPELGALDVYVTPPEVELSATAPLTSVQPLEYSESLEAFFGVMRIRLARAGTLEVVLDSGEIEFREVTDTTGPGAEWLFAIASSVVAGPSPAFLLASSGRSSLSVFDAGTPAVTRAIHGFAGLGPVDLEALTDPATVIVDDLAFGTRSARSPVPGGTVSLAFRSADAAEEPLATSVVTLVPGTEIVTALVNSDTGGTILIDTTNSRSVATEARLRLAHLDSGGDLVSAYLTSSADELPAATNRIIFNLPPNLITPQVAAAPGDYFLTLTTRPADDPSNDDDPVLFGPVPLPLAGGDVFTLALFPPAAEGEPAALEILDDTLP